ncbi:MAG: alanine racemase [Bacillota bacterium]|nr:alanine racemase [Bacillota bacterium]
MLYYPGPRRTPRPGMTRLEIDLDAVGGNYRVLSDMVRPVAVMAVVKDNAYGHGLVPVALRLKREGCAAFAVATLQEALVLAGAGIPASSVLILRALTSPELVIAVGQGFAVTVGDSRQLQEVDALAANGGGSPALVHLKLDTGLGRLGFLPAQAEEAASGIRSLTSTEVRGVYSHFAITAGGHPFMDTQLRRFNEACDVIGQSVPGTTRHIAASAATVGMREAWLDMVRPGGLLLGMAGLGEEPSGFKTALTLRAPVVHVKTVPAGWNVGYGLTYAAPDRQRIGIVAVGAGDSYPYALRGKSFVLVRGRRCRVVGMSLDQLMVDFSGVPDAVPGDEAVVIGSCGEESVSPKDLARLAGTSYGEILSRIPARVPRLYIENGYVSLVDSLTDLADAITHVHEKQGG